MLQRRFKNNKHKLINTEGLGNQAWNQLSSDTTLGTVDSSSVMFDMGWTMTGPIPKPNPTMLIIKNLKREHKTLPPQEMQETYFTKANIQLQQKHMLQPDAFKYEQNQIAGEL